MLNSTAPSHLIEDIQEVSGAKIYFKKIHEDDRGNFAELFREESLEKKFVQQNTSTSYGGVLRGMHIQNKNPQGKLISSLYGTILDVVFDVRPDSKTFGKGFSRILDSKSLTSLYVPEGCLHGFIALSRFAVVHYSCTTYYEPEHDGGVRWNSPELRHFFPEDISPMVSQKDQQLPLLSEYLATL